MMASWIHESTSDSENLVLTEYKNIYFINIGGTKKISPTHMKSFPFKSDFLEIFHK
jgi:hypothetical protein